ncbi:MAG: hypothetical protein QW254_01605 [Desulfurococcaceae archaeon]
MKWYIRRTLYTLLSWFLAITVTYAVIRASPGDPATILFSEFRAAGYSIEDARKLVQMYIRYIAR